MSLIKYIDDFNNECPLNQYPRPQLRRESFFPLNGKWEFTISKSNFLPFHYERIIIVPYCVESMLSNICQRVNDDEYLFYKKNVILPKNFIKDQLLLHFDAVDQECEIYINQQLAFKNHQGYLPFCFDILPYINNQNSFEIVVKVKDNLNPLYPYGKQKKENKGMWYTPVSGIWQSVWLESVTNTYIKKLTITPNIDQQLIHLIIDSSSEEFLIKIFDQDQLIYKQKTTIPVLSINLKDFKLWTPENPFLYDIEISCKGDEVHSYFAMRKFHVNQKHFLLNNQPYFVHGILDQGYFKEGIYTPPSIKAYEEDILLLKKLGFNTLRKHLKIEPLYFYYLCDKLGILVFQDIVNNGQYQFFSDTILPNIGIKNEILKNKVIPDLQKEFFKESLVETINHLYNSPSVVLYTLFNEGWGQHDSDKYYELAKQIDASRVIDTTSGWFKKKKSDVESIHQYFKNLNLKNKKYNHPVLLSEFGGLSMYVLNHSDCKKEYGYKKYKDLNALQNAIYEVYQKSVIENIPYGLAGCIYTQLSDVEDELNGLLTYDRIVLKVDVHIMQEIKNKILEVFSHE